MLQLLLQSRQKLVSMMPNATSGATAVGADTPVKFVQLGEPDADAS